MTNTASTRHTCGGPSFGRLTPGCPRCGELAAGAPARTWGTTARREGAGRRGAALERQRRDDITAHLASSQHRNGGCGPVCTFGEW